MILALALSLLAPNVCASDGSPRAFAVVSRAAATDSVVTVTVCLVADTTELHFAGYHGELALPPSHRVMKVERAAGGTRIENATLRGRVAFAGIAPSGFASGPLVTLVVVRHDASADAQLRLSMIDVTDASGREVAAGVQVD